MKEDEPEKVVKRGAGIYAFEFVKSALKPPATLLADVKSSKRWDSDFLAELETSNETLKLKRPA